MSIIENIRLALSGLRTSKMRSFLTMLGIIIGVGSVIGIVTIGNSLTSSVSDTMEEFGANSISAYVTPKESNSTPKIMEKDLITDDMVLEVRDHFGDRIKNIQIYGDQIVAQAKDGRRYANVVVFGTNENFLSNQNQPIIMGRDLNERDIQRASNVIVVSSKFVEKMFPSQVDPIGQEVKFHTADRGVLTFTIVGVYEYTMPAIAASFAPDEDMQTQASVPVSALQRIVESDEGYHSIQISFFSGDDSRQFSDEITAVFDKLYRSNPTFTVQAYSNEGMLDQFTSMMGTISIAISVIAGISLLVGGIGVMNIMLVSVTERTREIGTRKALGARSSAIRIQFIVESMILCLVGGLIGVLLGLGIGALGSALLGFPASPSIPAIIVAVLFSMFIGVFFGYYPANKAAQLDPIEALRYE